MLARGFNLQKWLTNDPVLQEQNEKKEKRKENMENNFKETQIILRSPNRSFHFIG